MHFPHAFITVAAACGLWWAGHAWSCARPSLRASTPPPAFGIPDSAYGSLTARLMRDSLYSYWHGGESATPALPAAAAVKDAPPPPPPPGRFSRLGRPAPPPPPVPATAPPEAPLLERAVTGLARLESARTKRNNRFPPTPAHRRYINAAAGWRLRLAHELDPGDAVLYEVLHYHITSQGQPPQATQKLVDELARKAIDHALTDRASMSDTLTGAGAAINLLNDRLHYRRTAGAANHAAADAAIRMDWQRLNQCLDRYRAIRRRADEEGWWGEIAPIRQQEIESHAAMLERVSETIRKTLADLKLVS